VAILQEHPPTPSTVIPQLRSALTHRIVVEQAKGFLRERLDISVDEAFSLLRRYARTHGDHLTDVARQLMANPSSRPGLLKKMTQLAQG
jgi:AmiR/NasT family two-component response regulator